MIATAYIGSGAVTMPAMVATNTANMRRAFGVNPEGARRNQMMAPTITGSRARAAVCQSNGVRAVRVVEVCVDDIGDSRD